MTFNDLDASLNRVFVMFQSLALVEDRLLQLHARLLVRDPGHADGLIQPHDHGLTEGIVNELERRVVARDNTSWHGPGTGDNPSRRGVVHGLWWRR